MNVRSSWFRGLMIAGLAGMIAGAIDPLEGSLLILPGSALAALAGARAGSRHRKLLGIGFGCVAAGVAALWLLSALGGIGGDSGRSALWGIVLLPYPVGWLMTVVGAALALVESYRRGTPVGQIVV